MPTRHPLPPRPTRTLASHPDVPLTDDVADVAVFLLNLAQDEGTVISRSALREIWTRHRAELNHGHGVVFRRHNGESKGNRSSMALRGALDRLRELQAVTREGLGEHQLLIIRNRPLLREIVLMWED